MLVTLLLPVAWEYITAVHCSTCGRKLLNELTKWTKMRHVTYHLAAYQTKQVCSSTQYTVHYTQCSDLKRGIPADSKNNHCRLSTQS